MLQAGSVSWIMGMGSLLVFLYQDIRAAFDPEYRRKDEERRARQRGRPLPPRPEDKTDDRTVEEIAAEIEGKDADKASNNNKKEKKVSSEDSSNKKESGAEGEQKPKPVVRRRRVVEEDEEDDGVIGFAKGAIVGYCIASLCVALVLGIMIWVGHDVEALVTAYTGQEVKIDYNSTHPMFLGLGLQKEFMGVKLALAGCLAPIMRRKFKL